MAGNKQPHPDFSPREVKWLRRLGRFIAGFLIVSFFLGDWGLSLYLCAWMLWMGAVAIVWAFRIDSSERDSKEVDLWDDMKDFEERVIKAFGSIKPKKKSRPRVKNAQTGEYMTCIVCGEYTNERGRFCDEHDDHKGDSFYDLGGKD